MRATIGFYSGRPDGKRVHIAEAKFKDKTSGRMERVTINKIRDNEVEAIALAILDLQYKFPNQVLEWEAIGEIKNPFESIRP